MGLSQQEPVRVEDGEGLEGEGLKLTPQQQWMTSEHSPQDLVRLMEAVGWEEWVPLMTAHIRTLSQPTKYQFIVRQFLLILSKLPPSQIPLSEKQQLYSFYHRQLAASYLVPGQISESSLGAAPSQPALKMLFIWEHYLREGGRLDEALQINYPWILSDLTRWISSVLGEQIVVDDEQYFMRFVIERKKLEEWAQRVEVEAQSCSQDFRRQLLAGLGKVHEPKQLYLQVVNELMRGDYASLAGGVLNEMKLKGYEFSEADHTLYIKIELYSLFIYECGQLQLSWPQVTSMPIPLILHRYFTSQDHPDIHPLLNCFQVHPNPTQTWRIHITNYLFSAQAHTSTLLRVIKEKHLTLSSSEREYERLLEKIKRSSFEVGKYGRELAGLVGQLDTLSSIQKARYQKYTSLLEIAYHFKIQMSLEVLYEIVVAEWDSLQRGILLRLKDQSLELIRAMINNYFTLFTLKQKTVQIGATSHPLATVFNLLSATMALRDEYLPTIPLNALHQIFFKCLLQRGDYVQVKALLSQERISTYSIQSQIIQVLVVEHLIQKLTTPSETAPSEQGIRMLLSILGLWPCQNLCHYALSYYQYCSYLAQHGITLPPELNRHPSLQHLYFVTDTYPHKIEKLDFDMLHSHIAIIVAQHSQKHISLDPPVTDAYLKFKTYLANKAFNHGKDKMSNNIMNEVARYEPPWLSTQLVRIIRRTRNCDEKFIRIAFRHCARAQDLKYLLDLHESQKQEEKPQKPKYTLQNFKKISKQISKDLINQDKFLFLTNDIIINESQYRNLVAEMTFSEQAGFREKNMVFFRLLGVEPDRAMCHALNYGIPSAFVTKFIQEGVSKGVIHPKNIIPLVIRYLSFEVLKEHKQAAYIGFREFKQKELSEIIEARANSRTGGSKTQKSLDQAIQSYHISTALSDRFLELYLPEHSLAQFLHIPSYRKDLLVKLREVPMDEANAIHWKQLCDIIKIDIVEVSLFNLISRVNAQEQVDQQSWNIVGKLIFWGHHAETARTIVKKLSVKVQALSVLLSLLEYMREANQNYQAIVTEQHLQIMRSLAAVEVDKNLFGIIPEEYFDRKIGVHPSATRGVLSAKHRNILQNNADITNIFVVSKALYFIYGCDSQIEKVVLGEFSLKQPDSEEFELLRKKIKEDSSSQ